MNELQKQALESILTRLIDCVSQIGPEFNLEWADAEGRPWSVKIKLETIEDYDDRMD